MPSYKAESDLFYSQWSTLEPFRASDLFDDGVGIGDQGDQLGIFVGFGEVSDDGGLEIDEAFEPAALESLLGPFDEEPLDSVEPGRRGRLQRRRAGWAHATNNQRLR